MDLYPTANTVFIQMCHRNTVPLYASSKLPFSSPDTQYEYFSPFSLRRLYYLSGFPSFHDSSTMGFLSPLLQPISVNVGVVRPFRRIPNPKPRYVPFAESLNLSENNVKTEAGLRKYLEEYEEYESKVHRMMLEGLKPPTQAFTSEGVPLPGPYFYRPKYKMSSWSPSELSCDIPHDARCTDNVWTKLKVSENMLSIWCENLRKWISKTIISGVVEEIHEINKRVCSVGSPESQIGVLNLLTLRQIAVSKMDVLPTLASLLMYLDLTLNQEYLVQRLKDLMYGGCMRNFKWNSGGSYKDRNWTPDLPTDSEIVMHLFCSYMDSKFPPDSHSVNGRSFSHKYFKKAPEKTAFPKKDYYIYQSKINPPHYVLVVGDEIYSPPKGRNNLFYAILLLLQYIKKAEYGMLGRVSLGTSGINILWILDQKT